MTISSSLRYLRGAAVGTAILASASCADLARTGNGPAYLIMDGVTSGSGPGLNSDVVNAAGTAVIDFGVASIRAEMKNAINPAAPTALSDITINRYRVKFTRTDGQNREGIDVPFGFDGATTVTISAPGGASVGFDLVRQQSKLEAPLRSLAGSRIIISTIAEVTFYGQDQAGNDVSVTGRIDVRFGDFPG
jgi:hypothetical protein